MAVFRHEILIARPIDVVFAAVADVTSHPRWQEGLLHTQVEGDSHTHVGARGVEVRQMFGREVRFPYEITVYNPPSTWGFRALEGPIRPAAVLSFNSQNGKTLITSELTVPGLLGSFFGRLLVSQQRRNYTQLKALLESG